MPEVRIRREAPRVWIVGISQPDLIMMKEYLEYRDLEWNSESASYQMPKSIVEMAGRVCYESFHNPKKTEAIEYILDTAIRKDHGSILEHVSVNFIIAGLPRTTLLELERHRAGTAFSFRSTRYVDNWLEFVIPPVMRGQPFLEAQFENNALECVGVYDGVMDILKQTDVKKKARTEAARSVLPSSLAADGMFTCNLRALLHILKLRGAEGADASMREFAGAVREACVEHSEFLMRLTDEALSNDEED